MLLEEQNKILKAALEKIGKRFCKERYPGYEDRDDLFGENPDDAYDKGVEAGEHHMGEIALKALEEVK